MIDNKTRFSESGQLPSLPEVAQRLMDVIGQPDVDYKELSQLISMDPALAGRILMTVNSPLLGLRRTIQAIDGAIPLLGLSLVRTLVLGFSLADYRQSPTIKAPMEVLWRRSLFQAAVAQSISKETCVGDPMSYFLAGLLQDVGQLAILVEEPEIYSEMVMQSEASHKRKLKEEHERWGVTHPEISQAIAHKWGLDEDTIKAIGQHHPIVSSAGGSSDSHCSLSKALQAAAIASPLMDIEDSNEDQLKLLHDFVWAKYGFAFATTERMVEDCCRAVDDYASLLSFDVGSVDISEKILRQAKQLLHDIAMNAQMQLVVGRRQENAGSPDCCHLPASENELYLDELTGFFNRRYMMREMEPLINKQLHDRNPVAVIFIDLDKFKDINDTHGHAAGDEAIRLVARELEKAFRRSDTLVRYGGDEFVAILPGLKSHQVSKVATRLVKDPIRVVLENGSKLGITLSVGGAFFQAKRGETIDPNLLVEKADAAMFDAKKSGGAACNIKEYSGAQALCEVG